MVKDVYIKRILGHFKNLVTHTTRPYDPSPSHLKKRLILPLCEDITLLIEKGNKNDYEKALSGISKICKQLSHNTI